MPGRRRRRRAVDRNEPTVRQNCEFLVSRSAGVIYETASCVRTRLDLGHRGTAVDRCDRTLR